MRPHTAMPHTTQPLQAGDGAWKMSAYIFEMFVGKRVGAMTANLSIFQTASSLDSSNTRWIMSYIQITWAWLHKDGDDRSGNEYTHISST